MVGRNCDPVNTTLEDAHDDCPGIETFFVGDARGIETFGSKSDGSYHALRAW